MNRLLMEPAPGERRVAFVGDYIQFKLKFEDGIPKEPGWRAFVRTNLGRATVRRQEIISAYFKKVPLFGASWHDIPMQIEGDEWVARIPLCEVGYFKAKAYVRDPRGWQHWPEGHDFGINVHPDSCRTGNIIYCAFTRLFGQAKYLVKARDEKTEDTLKPLDKQGYTIIPPSGKLRDLKREIPHIMDVLGCRIVHLLPINPTPTTFARFGRFGSPYAALDLTGIDPALVEFDKKTNSVDQFKELAYEIHKRGGLLFLDVVVNHTGWGSFLFDNHPEWYKRLPDGTFESPGAWGNIWADLVELDQKYPELWEHFANAFLTWCERGVDGFRCDAGYKIPVNVWQYIVARVQDEFPETIFLLEGLGGAWEATEELLTEGGMQWAYSELFQNYEPLQISGYLDHSIRQSSRVGILVHYSETHDNNRLAVKGKNWSLLRNRLCALSSVSGGFGFTCGVEWLATEKINVHDLSGLAWGASENIVQELSKLNRLLCDHPCFFDNAQIHRLSPNDSYILLLLRISNDEKDEALVIINTDHETPRELIISKEFLGKFWDKISMILSSPVNLLGNDLPDVKSLDANKIRFYLKPAEAFCLSTCAKPNGLSSAAYRKLRACAAFGFEAMSKIVPPETIGYYDWKILGSEIYKNPIAFLSKLKAGPKGERDGKIDGRADAGGVYPNVVEWKTLDSSRILPVPARHWVLIRDVASFRAKVLVGKSVLHLRSVETALGFVAVIPPQTQMLEGRIELERYGDDRQHFTGSLLFLSEEARLSEREIIPPPSAIVLLTNNRGGMARICVNLGEVTSKYDCVLGANLHPEFPVDRHIFVKRIRVWVNADGFLSPLNYENLVGFIPGNPCKWRFIANAGDGRAVEICLTAWMVKNKNTTVFQFCRSPYRPEIGKDLPPECDVRLTVRFDLEDRNFHWVTKRNEGAEYHFSSNCRPIEYRIDEKRFCGFEFTPAPERQLRVLSSKGMYHPSPEWSVNIPHPFEQTRGLEPDGDAYSPGWFEIPITHGDIINLVATAETRIPYFESSDLEIGRPQNISDLEDSLQNSLLAFIVKRGRGKTVIAGYPWFLDWGRDTLIAARGLIAANMLNVVKEIILTFAKYEENGTLPNAIFGDNTSNRDTSDAPLWFGILCEEFAEIQDEQKVAPEALIYNCKTENGRTVLDTLISIARNYIKGTPNGIKMDADTALVFSPSHFTWMDTNYPACSPREGYPVEIQALWIRLLRQLHRVDAKIPGIDFGELAQKAEDSFLALYWLEKEGWYSDVLLCTPNTSAKMALKDRVLRSNCLLPICLGVASGLNARRCVESVANYLVIPGALRSLAPLKADPPLFIRAPDGRLLNNPEFPYWGRYEGDEDTRRKPSYHNGTGWVWTYPHFCEALVRAWEFDPEAIKAAKSYLTVAKILLENGCIGYLPEIVDGDAPHTQRGCDAQAWSSAEFLRVLKLIRNVERSGK